MRYEEVDEVERGEDGGRKEELRMEGRNIYHNPEVRVHRRNSPLVSSIFTPGYRPYTKL